MSELGLVFFLFCLLGGWLMFDLIVYCFLGLCVLWDIGLVIFMMFESDQDERELENICNSHKLS